MPELTPEDWARIRPITFADVCNRVRPKFEGYEHWVMVFDYRGTKIIDIIEKRYFSESIEANEDLDVMALPPFAIVTARKRRLLAHQLTSIIRQASPIKLSQKTILSRDVLICTSPELLPVATALALTMLQPSKPGESAALNLV